MIGVWDNRGKELLYMDHYSQSLLVHEQHHGKINMGSKIPINNKEDLSVVYTPGVAGPCEKIYQNPLEVYKYTCKSNLVAVVSDGSAVLGLGNIGAEASLPVMEGKAILFKEFADIDAVPVCLATQDVDEIVKTIKYLEPTFGGINLEDISSPRCFEIEDRLKKELKIPVFHDDQHGTAIVTAAGLVNALKLVGKTWSNVRVVVNGPGAAGTAIVKMLLNLGAGDILVCDEHGILPREKDGLPVHKQELARITNLEHIKGTLWEALKGADVFIGVSVPGILNQEMVRSMNRDAIVFAMANPTPEIMPDLARAAGAKVIATGRSDFPNQINNVLAFPGIFRGALNVRAREINEAMKMAAVYAIAGIVRDEDLHENYIIPDPFDICIVEQVAQAVMTAAQATGAARI